MMHLLNITPKKIKKICYFTVLLSFFTKIIFASDLSECYQTPEIWELGILPKTYHTNNLTRKTGAAVFAKGTFIKITGKILDDNCVPVSGAKVRIWQANANGVYEFLKGNNELKDKNFTGSGISITDNLGRYVFYTVYPGKPENRVPHVMFKVQHDNFQQLETEMFFPEEKNNTDPILKNNVSKDKIHFLIAKYKKNELGYKVYQFNITLRGFNNYKEY